MPGDSAACGFARLVCKAASGEASGTGQRGSCRCVPDLLNELAEPFRALGLKSSDRLRVTFKEGADAAKAGGTQHDPWDYWVYRIGASGDVNGEESSSGQSYRGSFSANRTTDNWRLSFNASGRYRDSSFKIEEDDGMDTQPIISTSHSQDDLAVTLDIGAPAHRGDVLLAQLVAATEHL